MSRLGWAMLCAIVLKLVVCTASHSGEIFLESIPNDAHMAITGPVSLSGTAPLPLTGLPAGDYRLTADGPGLPAIKGRFVRSESGIVGRSWTGPGALLLPPGVVHLARGERRGWVLLGAGAASAAMSMVTESRVRDAEDDRVEALANYNSAVSESEIADARLALNTTSQEQEDYEELRGLWLRYFAFTWVGACVEAWLLTPQPSLSAGDSEGYVATLPRAGAWNAGIRSVLIPGAGQRYMGRNSRASFFTAATAILGAGALAAHADFLDARRDQTEAQWRFDQAETEEELRRSRRRLEDAAEQTDDKNLIQWSFAGAAVAIYLWNVIDAAGLGHQVDVPSVTLSMAPTSDGVTVGASWRIP